MGSLSQALSIALSGLQTTTSLISLASKNISNANTVGYTDKTATVSSVDFGGQFGGVEIASYSRATDQALTNDYNNSTSASSFAGTQNNYIKQIQSILDSSASTPALTNDIANFSAAWSNYSSNPESIVSQQSLISSGQILANDVQSITANVASLKTQIQGDISTNLKSLNADLTDIATLNTQIQQATTSGQQTIDLQDQMDIAINKVSSFMNVSVQPRANGQVALYTATGQVLVDEQVAKQFSYNGTAILDASGSDVTSSLVGGSLQAAVGFVSTSAADLSSSTAGVGTIGKLQAQIAKLVDSFTNSSGSTPSSFATAYSNAVTASTATGATQSGDTLASSFFSVLNDPSGNPDPSTFKVTATLTNGSAQIPQTGTQAIADSFNATQNYTASGLSASNVTYAGLTTAILSNFQQDANILKTQNDTATSQQTYFQQTVAQQTGVNTDTELANLVIYQNSYAASAHVMSTINQMLTTLMSTIQ